MKLYPSDITDDVDFHKLLDEIRDRMSSEHVDLLLQHVAGIQDLAYDVAFEAGQASVGP